MSITRFRFVSECVMAALTVAFGMWLVTKNIVPSGVFVASRGIHDLSPWVKNFWPPTFVYPVERGPDGRWQQRIVVSPVTLRVRTPRVFQSVEVAFDATQVPLGSTVGVERTLHSGESISVKLENSGSTLSLDGVNQSIRDLQFQFIFPNLTRDTPVLVHGLRFTFHR